MPALSATNCSAVIAPDSSADSPYWTPVLSDGDRTKPVCGSRPSWLTHCSPAEHFTPSGLDTGSHRASTGIAAGQLPVGVLRFRNVSTHEAHVL